MKQTITESQFIDAIVGDEYNSMSYEGAKALFEYLEQYEQDCDEDIEFDRVAIRCEFSEYKNLEEVLSEYDNIKSLSDLYDHTTVIEVPNSDKLIIQQF
jgi:hypothetical protein